MPSPAKPRAESFSRRKHPHRIIIARGGEVRTFTIRPWLAGGIAMTAAAFGAAYLAATGYLFFRDDLLTASIARQSRMQQAYEDRIALLRSDIDRLTSRQLLNQQQVEADVEKLVDRQAALDARQDVIAGISQIARRVGVIGPAAGGTPAADAPATDKTANAAGTPEAATPIRGPLPDAPVPGPSASLEPSAKIGAVSRSLESLAKDQVAYVDAIAASVSQRSQKVAAVLARLGQKVPASHAAGETEDVGGPFVPLSASSDPAAFRSGAALIADELERFGALRRIALRLPLTRPIPNAAITSRFGARMDPFLGEPAIHTGVDFRSPMGYPARVTADGTVTMAEYNGGYGNMVEVDHGNGITTRYGHLSKIEVKVGQVVSKGAIIGRTGSTGRSTGPHLHYEVRVDGEAIDPMRYIRAGSEIVPLL